MTQGNSTDHKLTVQRVQNLPFQVIAEAQNNTDPPTNENIPLNYKIRIKSKKEPKMKQAIISVPKLKTSQRTKNIRLVNSDQTIMSFDLFVDSCSNKVTPKKRDKFFSNLFRAGCLMQNDVDDDPYMPSASYNANEMDNVRDGNVNDLILDVTETNSLRKNCIPANNTTNSPKTFLGQCKAGGCLDPPFSEDKYAYKPTPISPITNNLISDNLNNSTEKIKNKSSDGSKLEIQINDKRRNSVISESLITYPHYIPISKTNDHEESKNASMEQTNSNTRIMDNELTQLYYKPIKKGDIQKIIGENQSKKYIEGEVTLEIDDQISEINTSSLNSSRIKMAERKVTNENILKDRKLDKEVVCESTTDTIPSTITTSALSITNKNELYTTLLHEDKKTDYGIKNEAKEIKDHVIRTIIVSEKENLAPFPLTVKESLDILNNKSSTEFARNILRNMESNSKTKYIHKNKPSDINESLTNDHIISLNKHNEISIIDSATQSVDTFKDQGDISVSGIDLLVTNIKSSFDDGISTKESQDINKKGTLSHSEQSNININELSSSVKANIRDTNGSDVMVTNTKSSFEHDVCIKISQELNKNETRRPSEQSYKNINHLSSSDNKAEVQVKPRGGNEDNITVNIENTAIKKISSPKNECLDKSKIIKSAEEDMLSIQNKNIESNAVCSLPVNSSSCTSTNQKHSAKSSELKNEQIENVASGDGIIIINEIQQYPKLPIRTLSNAEINSDTNVTEKSLIKSNVTPQSEKLSVSLNNFSIHPSIKLSTTSENIQKLNENKRDIDDKPVEEDAYRQNFNETTKLSNDVPKMDTEDVNRTASSTFRQDSLSLLSTSNESSRSKISRKDDLYKKSMINGQKGQDDKSRTTMSSIKIRQNVPSILNNSSKSSNSQISRSNLIKNNLSGPINQDDRYNNIIKDEVHEKQSVSSEDILFHHITEVKDIDQEKSDKIDLEINDNYEIVKNQLSEDRIKNVYAKKPEDDDISRLRIKKTDSSNYSQTAIWQSIDNSKKSVDSISNISQNLVADVTNLQIKRTDSKIFSQATLLQSVDMSKKSMEVMSNIYQNVIADITNSQEKGTDSKNFSQTILLQSVDSSKKIMDVTSNVSQNLIADISHLQLKKADSSTFSQSVLLQSIDTLKKPIELLSNISQNLLRNSTKSETYTNNNIEGKTLYEHAKKNISDISFNKNKPYDHSLTNSDLFTKKYTNSSIHSIGVTKNKSQNNLDATYSNISTNLLELNTVNKQSNETKPEYLDPSTIFEKIQSTQKNIDKSMTHITNDYDDILLDMKDSIINNLEPNEDLSNEDSFSQFNKAIPLATINLDLHISSYDDNSKFFIRTFDPMLQPQKHLEDKFVSIKRVVTENDEEIKIPINSDLDFTIGIERKTNPRKIFKETKGIHKTCSDGNINNNYLLHDTLNSVYNNLLPVKEIINSLRQEIKLLSQQQTQFIELLNKMETKPLRLINNAQKCKCYKQKFADKYIYYG